MHLKIPTGVLSLLAFAVFPTGCVDASSEPDAGTDIDVDGLVSDIAVTVHDEVSTILEVTWTQIGPVDDVRLRFTFENDEWYESPRRPGTTGARRESVLGVPELTDVTIRLVLNVDGTDIMSAAFTGTTGALPPSMPRPTLIDVDPDLVGPERWLLGSVENSPCYDTTPGRCYYSDMFWLFIVDRRGRIVWYYTDALLPTMTFPRVARDNSHLYVEKRMFSSAETYAPKVVRMTLNHTFHEEIDVPDLDDCFDVLPDGTILFNTFMGTDEAFLKERLPNGTIREIWDCLQWAADSGADNIDYRACYSNTVNWNPLADTVLMSMPYVNAVVEIDRQTGALVSQWGDPDGSAPFIPASWELEFNHFANITDAGTLIVSSHFPGEDPSVPGEHRFIEFDIDPDTRALTERWVYGEGIDDWPMYKGEAYRLPGGNTLANYGTGGTIREITPDGATAWHLKWDADFDDDHFNKMVGHTLLIDDLYALCAGWEE